MFKPAIVTAFLLIIFTVGAQEVSLPADLRQHSLNQYNASLFNPAFSLDRNNPQSIALWTRWQWQSVDADPTTLFLNYSLSLNDNSAAALGFFQQNTGIYFNTGGAINYAYQIEFNRLIKLSFGANIFGFVQQLADTRFPITPLPGLPQTEPTDDFILQVAPGFNLQVENFSLSLASENLFDYNFTDQVSNTATADKIFMGMASYDFPVMASDSTAFIRPSVYLRTIPEQDNQIGLNVLFSNEKYWVQSGFNNFYGISVGAGATLFKRASLGALVELGTSGSINSKDPSFELIASYYLGKPAKRRPLVASGILDETQQVTLIGSELTVDEIQEKLDKAEKLSTQRKEVTAEIAEQKAKEDAAENIKVEEKVSLNEKQDKKEQKRLIAAQKLLKKQKRKDLIAQSKITLALKKKQEAEEAKRNAEAVVLTKKVEEKLAKKNIESTEIAKRLEEERVNKKIKAAERAEKLVAEQAKKDAEAVAKAKKIKEEQAAKNTVVIENTKEIESKKAIKPEVVKLQAGEKYEEVASEDGLEPGYYLIANVFGTKKYFDAFLMDLVNKGLQPKSFYRSANKYNYAYLNRYTTISEARQARDSKFNGKYSKKLWIFRVIGK